MKKLFENGRLVFFLGKSIIQKKRGLCTQYVRELLSKSRGAKSLTLRLCAQGTPAGNLRWSFYMPGFSTSTNCNCSSWHQKSKNTRIPSPLPTYFAYGTKENKKKNSVSISQLEKKNFLTTTRKKSNSSVAREAICYEHKCIKTSHHNKVVLSTSKNVKKQAEFTRC